MHANVEDRGIKGDITPLMAAANGGHVKIVKLLLAHKADVNAQSSTGHAHLPFNFLNKSFLCLYFLWKWSLVMLLQLSFFFLKIAAHCICLYEVECV